LRADLGAAPTNPGTHIALRASSEDAVRAFHAAALELGGTTGGDPGPRQAAMTTYFGAFILDPDGNKIEALAFPPRQA
jgi:catechol 2,3-dioxygenase-like lactoylglutathione lyase family enzyme